MNSLTWLLSVSVISIVSLPLAHSQSAMPGKASGASSSGAASGYGSSGYSSSGTSGANQQAAINYKVIYFKQGSSELDTASKDTINSLIDSSKAKGEIAKVHLAVWSDKSFPMGQNELKSEDKKLASDRIDAITNYLKGPLKVSSLDKHNMAEKTSWMARAFNSADAELKSMFAQRGAPVTDREFNIVKNNGGESKAVVWVDLKESAAGQSKKSKY
jgi:hypothetical protein